MNRTPKLLSKTAIRNCYLGLLLVTATLLTGCGAQVKYKELNGNETTATFKPGYRISIKDNVVAEADPRIVDAGKWLGGKIIDRATDALLEKTATKVVENGIP